ncbi:MAG: NAD(P)-dependent oxidoreductase [Candidatus Bathyarchaeia archaeon]
MRVLITGGTGWLGFYVTERFVREGYEVICYDLKPSPFPDFIRVDPGKARVVKGDILELPHLLRTARENEVEGIVHLAFVLNEPLMREFPLSVAHRINVEGTMKVLEVARLLDLRLVFASSGAVFGDRPDAKPLREDDIRLENIDRIYAANKIMCEAIVNSYVSAYGLDAVSMRPGMMYGPGMWMRYPIAILLERAIYGMSTRLPFGGDMPFDWIYGKDAAKAFFLGYSVRPIRHRVFNISDGKGYTLRETAEVVRRLIPNAVIEIGPGLVDKSRLDSIDVEDLRNFFRIMPLRGPMDSSRMREELGFKPDYTLESGAEEYFKWLHSHKER